MKKILLTSVAALFLATGTAHASINLTCIHGNGEDEIVNLYLKPNTRSKILKVFGGATILTLDDHPTMDFKDWAYVYGMYDIDEGWVKHPRGWVRKKYIEQTKCPTENSK
jgi:hypothetical protein